ncbi:MAG: DUF4393 domain-containing protein [bacterium]|nr:DUF4393 domain-containing protein [bacterium]
MLSEDEIVKEMIKANATEAYRDAAQPAVRVVGQSIAQCVSLFVTPIGRMAAILEKNLHLYLDKLDRYKEKELISPDVRILVPILEKLRYTEDIVVAEYYAEILAKASTKENSKRVLISFIEILNRLSSDEIKILEYINSNDNIVDFEPITEEESGQLNLPAGFCKAVIKGAVPVIDIKIVQSGTTGFSIAGRNCNLLPDLINLSGPRNIDSYVDNMISLGLLERPHDRSFANKKIYSKLENDPNVIELQKGLAKSQRIEFDRAQLAITSLGVKLLELCSTGVKP